MTPKTQYSPEVIKVTDTYILLNDWQNIEGKSYHVSLIFDRANSTFYHLRDEVLRKYSTIKLFVMNNQFFWDVISYSNKYVTVEVRLNPMKKRILKVKL